MCSPPSQWGFLCSSRFPLSSLFGTGPDPDIFQISEFTPLTFPAQLQYGLVILGWDTFIPVPPTPVTFSPFGQRYKNQAAIDNSSLFYLFDTILELYQDLFHQILGDAQNEPLITFR